jgi:hypothetical protein
MYRFLIGPSGWAPRKGLLVLLVFEALSALAAAVGDAKLCGPREGSRGVAFQVGALPVRRDAAVADAATLKEDKNQHLVEWVGDEGWDRRCDAYLRSVPRTSILPFEMAGGTGRCSSPSTR